MKLPHALAHWARHLQIFPDEISLILGSYVQRIAPFVNALDASSADENGEPNGYDGVARRGIYERLLLSELALADDFGDEFVRRAVMGEHLFLNLAKVSPGAKRVSIALFDAGALQLGAPRIAHLAALIVLARRADAAGAMFLWGILQDAEARRLVISDDTEASVKILLESRNPNEANAENLAAWSEKLRDAEKIDDLFDVWLVGSEALAQFEETKSFSHLFVEENWETENRELSLKVKNYSGAEKHLTLELPPAEVCTRLLRNPFEIAARARKITDVQTDGAVANFFFDSTGAKIFAKFDAHNLHIFSVQNIRGRGGPLSPQNSYKSVDWQTKEEKPIIAAGRLYKVIGIARKSDDRSIYLEYSKYGYWLPQGIYRLTAGEIFFPDNDDQALMQLFNIRPKGYNDGTAFLDAVGNLFLLNKREGDRDRDDPEAGTLSLFATGVLAVSQNWRDFSFVGCQIGSDTYQLVTTADIILNNAAKPVESALDNHVERRSFTGMNLRQAFFGRGRTNEKICAVADDAGNWTIYDENFQPRPMPPPQGEVVGVFQHERLAPEAGLIELSEDRKKLEFIRENGYRKQILYSKDEIVKVEFSPQSPLLAYQTASGELVIFSLKYLEALGHYTK